MMPKFAVFYVPRAEDELYHLGTSILGYDVRASKNLKIPKELEDRLKGFDQGWVKYSRPFGFHLTISGAVDFRFGDMLSIEREIDDILDCFDPEHPFTLRKSMDNFVTFWGKQEEVVVLRYDPNEYMRMLHTLIVARVQSLGTGSNSLRRYLEDPKRYADRPYGAHRVLKFYDAPILDGYSPHFTLLNPYTGNNHEELVRHFSELFGHFSNITVDSICLLVQMHERENWKILREFKRQWYPRNCVAQFSALSFITHVYNNLNK